MSVSPPQFRTSWLFLLLRDTSFPFELLERAHTPMIPSGEGMLAFVRMMIWFTRSPPWRGAPKGRGGYSDFKFIRYLISTRIDRKSTHPYNPLSRGDVLDAKVSILVHAIPSLEGCPEGAGWVFRSQVHQMTHLHPNFWKEHTPL